jgi:hypothetical protein
MIQKYFLPALKYYNPSIQIHVDNPTDIKEKCRIDLTFEHSNPQQLMQLQKNKMWDEPTTPKDGQTPDDSSPKNKGFNFDIPQKPLERTRRSRNVVRSFTPGENGLESSATKLKSYNPDGLLQFNCQVIPKPQPASGKSDPSLPQMYTRTIGRRLDHKDVKEIWPWIRNLAGQRTVGPGDRVQLSPEEMKLKEELAQRAEKAQADRVREEAFKAAKKAEEAELEKAKRAVQEAEGSAV